MMKEKYISVLILFICLINNIFAQAIELPDITTEVESENIKAGNDTLPDFSDVFEMTKGSGSIVPVLPDKTSDININKKENAVAKKEENKKKPGKNSISTDNVDSTNKQDLNNSVNEEKKDSTGDNEANIPDEETGIAAGVPEKEASHNDDNAYDNSRDKNVPDNKEKGSPDKKINNEPDNKSKQDEVKQAENKQKKQGEAKQGEAKQGETKQGETKKNETRQDKKEKDNTKYENDYDISEDADNEVVNVKNIFTEINIGGGFPALFYGDCLISNSNIDNPYRISFNYDSANGYKGHDLSDNFYDRTVKLLFEKKYKKDKLNVEIFSDINSVSNGLQQQSKGISAINQDMLLGKAVVKYDIGNNIFIGSDTDISLYNRYGFISSENSVPKWLKKNNIFTFDQSVYGQWSGYGFDTVLGLNYLGAFNIGDNIEGGDNNRGAIEGSVKWSKNFFDVYGDFAIVIGSHLQKGNVIVPFNVGIDFSFPVYFSNRKFRIYAEGGLESYYTPVEALERRFRFAALTNVPIETSFWNCKLKLYIPLKSSFSANVSVEYKNTAFDNGVWEPDYYSSSEKFFENGLYKIVQKSQQLLITDFSVTYQNEMFAVKGGLYSNWLDIPALEGMQIITLDLSFQDEDFKWGANLSGRYKIDKDWVLPVINLGAFMKLSSSMSINISLCDIIPMFNASTRIYAGNFADRGFEASLFLNFCL